LIAATEGFTGADLKALVEDGKAIYAYDHANGHQPQNSTDYFLRAVTAVKENKQHYAAAEAKALLRPKSSMAGFFGSMAAARALKDSQSDD
jgi:hypothetical protein